MPTAPIPLLPRQRSGLASLSGGSPVAHNVVADRLGAVMRRPGLKAYSGAVDEVIDEDGISALTSTPDGKLWVVPSSTPTASIYRVTSGGSRDITTPPTRMRAEKRVTLTKTEALIVLAAGSRIHKVTLATETADFLGGGPPEATHVIAHGGRLLVNHKGFQSRIDYSGIATGGATAGHEDWSSGLGAGGFFSAEARPDKVVALQENTNEVFAFGETSTQVFVPSPSFVYQPGATREYGCAAPYGIINRDQAFAWMDHKRRIVVTDGRKYEVISDDIQKTLDELSRVDDCFGYRVRLGYVDALVWTFPTDGRTFVWQEGLWGQWSGEGLSKFRVTAHHQRPNDGVNIVGDENGYISELDLETATDRGDPIPAEIITGFQNHDTDATKMCRNVRLAFERGKATGDAPEVFLYYRDVPGSWGAPLQISLGSVGDREIVVPLGPLGTYRRRDWRIVFTGTEQFKLVGAWEDFEVLSY